MGTLLAFLTVLALAASTSGEPAQKKKADESNDLYVMHCQFCHGPDGRAPVEGMSFVGRKWKTKTHAEAVKIITTGVPGTAMLPFESKLTKEEIAALARYVRALDSPAARKKKP
jgi:mono/diheme cytochrome c family protein